MTIKYPKYITYRGFDLKVIKDPTAYMSEFDCGVDNIYKESFIKIGTKNKCVTAVLSGIIHELVELIATHHDVRGVINAANNRYMFAYNHETHTRMCDDLGMLLQQFIK